MQNAQDRRRERRSAKQAEWKAANPLLVGFTPKPEARQQLKLNRKPVSRVEKSINPIALTYRSQLEQAAEFHAEQAAKREERARRKHQQVKNPLGYQINAHQKRKGCSIPLV